MTLQVNTRIDAKCTGCPNELSLPGLISGNETADQLAKWRKRVIKSKGWEEFAGYWFCNECSAAAYKYSEEDEVK